MTELLGPAHTPVTPDAGPLAGATAAGVVDAARALVDADAAWDRLAGSRVYSSTRWLRFCGDAERVVDGPAANPTAAAVLTRVRERGHAFYAWSDVLTARGLPAIAPTGVLVGASRGYRAHVLSASPEDRVAAAAWVAGEARRRAGDESAVAMFLDADDVAAFRAAGVLAPPVLHALDATLDLPPGGWDAYVASLSSNRRNAVRRDARRFAESGLRVEQRPAAECAPAAGRLMAAIEARHGHYADAAGLTAAFAAQADAMGDAADVVFAVDADGTEAGFCLWYRWGGVLHVRAVGMDPDAARGAGAYFELMCRRSVLAAYEHGCTAVHFGIAASDAKARRGATLRGAWLLDLRPDSPLVGLDDAVTAANARCLAELAAGSPFVLGALDLDVATLAPDVVPAAGAAES